MMQHSMAGEQGLVTINIWLNYDEGDYVAHTQAISSDKWRYGRCITLFLFVTSFD